MTYRNFMDTKHFGEIYRPYADFVASIQSTIDSMLAFDPNFGRFFLPLLSRDLIFINGKKITMLAISESSYRHNPLRVSKKWNEFFEIQEDAFIEEFNLSLEPAELPPLNNFFEEKFHFKNTIVIIFSSEIFLGYLDPKQTNKLAPILFSSNVLFARERKRYERYLEMQKPKEIFLSHKTIDKPLVRAVADTLAAIGFSPWLDEDKMKAGANLERELRQGFADSCSAVFFITANFKDEGYLAIEIDYAIAEKRSKGDRFAIITILLEGEDGAIGEIPLLLRPYVYKNAKPIEITRIIIEALPIRMENIIWKE